MEAVGGKQDQDYKVRYEQRHVERIGAVKALERGVEKVLADVLREPVLGEEKCEC